MRWLALTSLVVLATGCGGGMAKQRLSPKAALATHEERACSLAMPVGGDFRTCFTPGASIQRPTIEHKVGTAWKVVARPLKPLDPTTMWGDVMLSPDGRTLLAAWLYACDGRIAVFVPADGGEPRIVTGERKWTRAAASEPLGWTKTGKARVRVYDRWGLGRRRAPGVYLFDPRGRVAARPAPARGC